MKTISTLSNYNLQPGWQHYPGSLPVVPLAHHHQQQLTDLTHRLSWPQHGIRSSSHNGSIPWPHPIPRSELIQAGRQYPNTGIMRSVEQWCSRKNMKDITLHGLYLFMALLQIRRPIGKVIYNFWEESEFYSESLRLSRFRLLLGFSLCQHLSTAVGDIVTKPWYVVKVF